MPGSLINLGDNPDIKSFPAAQFEIEGDVPNTQCAEAQIESDAGQTSSPPPKLIHTGAFAGYNLTGKVLHITASVGGLTGDFPITSNTDDECALDVDPQNGNPVSYYITDGGELILTRDTASFAAFIHDAGYAYTFKGGKLHTDIPPGLLQPACTITFDPLT